jgi:4-diphosphocytidyl-2-C-methyl-D-erythritol kinase
MLSEKSFTRVTLALDIIRKLDQGQYAGYHELGIIKHRIDLHDIISIEPSETPRITCDNPSVPCDERNICWKVADTLKREFGISQNVHIAIKKNIPVQGGLAGGSANAATILSLLNKFWRLNLSDDQLRQIGRKAGMDVPFYFTGGTAFDTESSGILEPIHTGLVFDFVLAIPPFGVSTSEAYQTIEYASVARHTHLTGAIRSALESNDRTAVIESMHNDFELSVFRRYPQLALIKEELLHTGCLNAVLSGSGSTILGIARNKEHAALVKKSLSVPVITASTLV